MKPNSCLYRAVRDVCKYQFGLDISSQQGVFDDNNDGRGIRTYDAFSVIDEALHPFAVGVGAILGKFEDRFSHSCLICTDDYVAAPCIGYVNAEQHAFAVLPGDDTITTNMAFTLVKLGALDRWTRHAKRAWRCGRGQ